MKAQAGMIWKVTILWRGDEQTYTLEKDDHIGAFIKSLKAIFPRCKVIERWQEPIG